MPDPGGVLGEIARRKRVDVAARLGGVSAAELRPRARRAAQPRRGAGPAGRALHHGGEEGSPSAGAICARLSTPPRRPPLMPAPPWR